MTQVLPLPNTPNVHINTNTPHLGLGDTQPASQSHSHKDMDS